MFLILNHQKLDAYSASKEFVAECYRFSKHLPPEERFAMSSQIRRAALSVHLNIAEGSSRKSIVERKRFYEISRGSMIEIDAAFDIAEDLNYFKNYPKETLQQVTAKCFRILTGLINQKIN